MTVGSEAVANLWTDRFLSGFFCCLFCSCKTTDVNVRQDNRQFYTNTLAGLSEGHSRKKLVQNVTSQCTTIMNRSSKKKVTKELQI